jgi:diadenosine tetraphosphate (Ap4A) HIT family hydrolase
MMNVARRIAAAHRAQDSSIEGINLYLADSPAAGQEVPHAHIHVIPRRKGDGFRLSINRGETPTREELAATAERVAAALG